MNSDFVSINENKNSLHSFELKIRHENVLSSISLYAKNHHNNVSLLALMVTVLRDLTCVLFDQKLIVQLMNPHPCQHVLTVQQCRILLTDIACCSLMRLDMTSMDKLWDLMVMLFKWQLYMIRENPTRLLELTFRHMDGVAKLMPEMKKTLLVDSTKRCLIEFWDVCTADQIDILMDNLLNWMQPFNVKISILIRSGFQRNDGTFETVPEQVNIEHFQVYISINVISISS